MRIIVAMVTGESLGDSSSQGGRNCIAGAQFYVREHTVTRSASDRGALKPVMPDFPQITNCGAVGRIYVEALGR